MRSLGEQRREAARCVQAHVRGWLTRCRMLHWKAANRKLPGILRLFGSSSAARDKRISSYRRLESGELPNAYATPGGWPYQDSAPGSSNANPGGKGVAPPPSHSYANALRGARRKAHSLPNPFKAATHLAAVEADRMLERQVGCPYRCGCGTAWRYGCRSLCSSCRRRTRAAAHHERTPWHTFRGAKQTETECLSERVSACSALRPRAAD